MYNERSLYKIYNLKYPRHVIPLIANYRLQKVALEHFILYSARLEIKFLLTELIFKSFM